MEKYADQPFTVLGFPCNQFLRQEPGANATEIYAVLKHIRPGDGFVPNFPMFAKTDVNGKNQNPIYSFLKSRCPPPREEFSETKRYYYDPFHGNDIRWNFEKFLITPDGTPVRRYDESLDPMMIVPDIENELRKMEDDQS
jgi:glutathione peroxidase